MFHGQGGDGMMEMIHTIQANSIAYYNCFHILVGMEITIQANDSQIIFNILLNILFKKYS